MIAEPGNYLREFVQDALRAWPENRTLTIVCHGHSVPAGYFATPTVDTFAAYPHLWHRRLKERFPYAPINVITTAIGGENAEEGAARFVRDVIPLRPDLVTIDYGLNDRGLGLERAQTAWEEMVQQTQEARAKVILLTPTWDIQATGEVQKRDDDLTAHARQIRALAEQAGVGLADPYTIFERYVEAGGALVNLLSWRNHPNQRGHELVVDELMRWIPFMLP